MVTNVRSSFVPLFDALTRPQQSTDTFVSIQEMLDDAQALRAENRRIRTRLSVDASHWERCPCCDGDFHTQMQSPTCPHRLTDEQARTLTII